MASRGRRGRRWRARVQPDGDRDQRPRPARRRGYFAALLAALRGSDRTSSDRIGILPN